MVVLIVNTLITFNPQPLTNLQRGNVVQEKTPVKIERTAFELAAQGEIFPGITLDFNQVDQNGMSLVHVASTHGQLQTLKYLLNRGCNPLVRDIKGHLPLHCASHSGHHTIVKELLSRNRDVVDEVNIDGNTSLMYACHENHCQVAQELLRLGADVTIVNKSGETAYSIAIQRRHKDIQSLLEKHIFDLIEKSVSLFQ